MKNTMIMNIAFKKSVAAVLLLLSVFAFASCSGDKEDEVEYPIQIEDLPATARQFLTKFFPGMETSKIEEEIDGNVKVYVVNLKNGFEVVFNSDGDWQAVEAPYNETVPTGIIPEQVMATLNQQYNGYGVNEINTTGEGWKVELSDNQGGAGIDLWFNMSGEIIQTSQDNV